MNNKIDVIEYISSLGATDRANKFLHLDGNSVLARGGFGLVKLAIERPYKCKQVEETSISENNVCSSPRYVAIKTIHDAFISTHTGRGKYASWSFNDTSSSDCVGGNSEGSEPQNKRSLSKPAFLEINVLRKLCHHPCIITLITHYSDEDDPSSLSLVFPYCPSDLADIIERARNTTNPSSLFAKGRIENKYVKAICRDMLSAVVHCHKHGIMHRDIKPGNILLSSSGRFLLADFGLVKDFKNESHEERAAKNVESTPSDLHNYNCDGAASHALCTLHYRSPEVLFGSRTYGPEVDVYGCGLVLCEILNLRPLFPGTNNFDQIARVFQVLGTPGVKHNWPEAVELPDFGKVSFPPSEPICIMNVVPRTSESEFLLELVSAMISIDPKLRPSSLKCLEHSWFFQHPIVASPHAVVQMFVSDNVREPRLLFPSQPSTADDNNSLEEWKVEKEWALEVAKARRSKSFYSNIMKSKSNIKENDLKSKKIIGQFQPVLKSNGLSRALYQRNKMYNQY